ncbi:MAG: phosphatase PAP2 family protein [Planctomycetota bacterium]|nr:phosphatase PAP2 family protein [Planctomycetota bacterium]
MSMLAGCASVSRSSREHLSNAVSKFELPKRQFPADLPSVDTGHASLSKLRFVSYDSVTSVPDGQSLKLVEPESNASVFSSPSSYFEHQSLNNSTVDLESIVGPSSKPSVWGRLASDQSNFYSRDSLIALGLVFGTGAAVANSNVDVQIHKHFESSVRSASSDDWFNSLHASKELGNGVYTLPIMGAAWLANEYVDGPPAFEHFGTWGERSMRAFIVGAPPLIAMQRLTGGSRPYETNEGSEWHPFRDNNGVSGHAFMSSLPFITAAKMTDNPWEKSLWYLGSTLGPLSRLNDNAHYPSQIGMGWAMAFVAATAVQQSDTGKRGWRLVPESPSGGSGFAFQYKW